MYGCAIPTVAGLRQVLDALGASGGRRQVLWHNMREEPVIYVSNTRMWCFWRTCDKPCFQLQLRHAYGWQGSGGWPGMGSVTMGTATQMQINGRPFVVREADKPFQNLEYTGIDRTRAEDMERRLKADVLREVYTLASAVVYVAREAIPQTRFGCHFNGSTKVHQAPALRPSSCGAAYRGGGLPSSYFSSSLLGCRASAECLYVSVPMEVYRV